MKFHRNVLTVAVICIILMIIPVKCKAGDTEMNEDDYFSRFDSVAYVQISDAFNGFYEEALEDELTEEEISAFLQSRNNFELTDKNTGSRAYYKLTFLDKEKNILDVLTVNTAYTIVSDLGVNIKKNEAIDAWLEMIQNNHDITYQLFERAPGEQFFSQLQQIQKGRFSEKTENNFVEGLEYSFDEEDIENLISIGDEIQIADEPEAAEWKYQINFYSENGAGLYTFLSTEDGNVYTSNGYELTGEKISDWWSNIIEKTMKIQNIN